MALNFYFLKEKPEVMETLAQAVFDQWSSMYARRGESADDVQAKMVDRAVDDRIPLTMVGFDGDTLIGSVTIKNDDFARRSDLNPWIAGVFVLPEHRGKGYSRELIAHAETVAKERFDLDKIYLYTGSAEGLYIKTGYTVVERFDSDTRELVVMEKRLS